MNDKIKLGSVWCNNKYPLSIRWVVSAVVNGYVFHSPETDLQILIFYDSIIQFDFIICLEIEEFKKQFKKKIPEYPAKDLKVRIETSLVLWMDKFEFLSTLQNGIDI